MVKPIGNLTANRPPKDKVGAHLKMKYGPKTMGSPQVGSVGTGGASQPAPKPPRYKKRKK